ncbi:MAG TPA: PAS domain-containing sensor histidine kinase [Paracoccaceae bacterium]|nr:PAS domain-containing sensor histidine kinase [Paracoccaceae bacterium]
MWPEDSGLKNSGDEAANEGQVAESGNVAESADRHASGPAYLAWIRGHAVSLAVALGPILAILTAWALSDGARVTRSEGLLRFILLIDLAYVLALCALIAWRLGALVAARRRSPVGTRLHLRLAAVFASVALVPTVIVAIFATLTLGFGLESLFTDRIGSVVRNSLATAEAYEREHLATLRKDATNMAGDLNRAMREGVTQEQLNEIVSRQALIRDLPRAYIFNLEKQIIARGEFSYLFNFVEPSDEQLSAARRGETVLISDPARDEIRGLIFLADSFDSFLYVSHSVQGAVLRLLDQTRDTVQFYERIERERGDVLMDYALIYLGFALLVILASILMGLRFAERLAKPVGQLASAAERVGGGDLDVRVAEKRGDDEIAMLGRVFNRMTGQLKGQRDALVSARDETEKRRQFIEAVLSGVTAGIIGLDGEGRVELMNEAAAEMLALDLAETLGAPLARVAPGMEALYVRARAAPGAVDRGEVRQMVRGEEREFLARVAPKSPGDLSEGFVLTFDDMTALASAQRMAAWGDVARRIAHEIKNPLTPIQLSADRLRRKFRGKLGPEGNNFEQYLDVITRQAGDIRRMVDEFSRFARMPEPTLAVQDLSALVREAVLLQEEAHSQITYRMSLPPESVEARIDRGLFGQVLTNLLQNAADSLEARAEEEGEQAPPGEVSITLEEGTRSIRLVVEDNGIGLPREGRERLTDPYVTMRTKGTGLGLAIVNKIVEQHGGKLVLDDAEGLRGARVSVRLPRQPGRNHSGEKKAGEAA